MSNSPFDYPNGYGLRHSTAERRGHGLLRRVDRTGELTIEHRDSLIAALERHPVVPETASTRGAGAA